MNNPFLKRLMKDKTKDVIHTSAYGEAQNSGKIGSTSSESFTKRLGVDKNRTRVKAYNDSRIVNDARGNMPRPKVYEPSMNRGSEDGARTSTFSRSDTSSRSAVPSQPAGPSLSVTPSRFAVPSQPAVPPRFTDPPRSATPPARKNPGIFR